MLVMCYVVLEKAHKRPQPWWGLEGKWICCVQVRGWKESGLMMASSVGGVLCWGCQVKRQGGKVTAHYHGEERKEHQVFLTPYRGNSLSHTTSKHGMRLCLNPWWMETPSEGKTGSLCLLTPTEWVLLCLQIWAESALRVKKCPFCTSSTGETLEPKICISTKMK